MSLTLICKKCQKEFKVSEHEKNRLFCSKKCQLNFVRKVGQIKNVSNCLVCNKEFEHYGERVVCSKECLAKYQSEQRLNENNPSWIDNKEKAICKRCGKEFEYTRIGSKRLPNLSYISDVLDRVYEEFNSITQNTKMQRYL